MPDCNTLWNLRKNIILELIKNKNQDEMYKFIQNEILQISGIMKKNPKSYALWYHRIWNLRHAAEIEKIKNLQTIEESILFQEIGLCDKFLSLDDRNFHCWNYRFTIFKMILEFFPDKFLCFLDKELQFTINMIKKNFSNFSSWHYRSKLIPIYFEKKQIDWNSPEALNFFKTDLEYITNAIYTDPKDQSPWNYHLWIINNLTPMYIEKYDYDKEKNILQIFLSDIIKVNEVIELNGLESNDIILKSQELYSNTITLDLNLLKMNENSNHCIEFSLNSKRMINSEKLENSLFNLKCFSRHNLLLPKINISYKNHEVNLSFENNNFTLLQIEFLQKQLEIINKLISSTDGFLEYAHYRKAQILSILYNSETPQSKNQEIKDNFINEYKFLSENSKRMKQMYQDFIKN